MNEFVELDRRFETLRGDKPIEDLALESYTRALFDQQQGVGWKDLLDCRLAVILGEPGSGKTRELRNQAERKKASGEFSFFVRLDQLATQPIIQAFGPEEVRRLELWKESRSEGFFFLDSVDEAKLVRDSDFDRSLIAFRDELGIDRLARARIYLSSRISDWRPQSDLEQLLQFTPSIQKGRADVNNSTSKASPNVLVVQIMPLDKVRVSKFARALNVVGPDEFVDALDSNHAWDLARRPGDVVWLVDFWNPNKRLGSLTELSEQAVRSNLDLPERDIRTDPLTPGEAREGAEMLAAASVFCKQLNFKVPDDVVVNDALNADRCLFENWRKEKVRSLLDRPVFDSASYGQIRFHTRRLAEYLTASWIQRAVRLGCSVSQLEGLLFGRIKGRKVLRRTLAPVVAWLCTLDNSWREDIRGWILESDPELHLQYGDPQGLPFEYKVSVLKAITEKYKGRSHLWLELSPQQLSRLGDSRLAPYLEELISNPETPMDLRKAMLSVVRYSHIAECYRIAIDIVALPTEDEDLRVYAATALRDSDDFVALRRLVDVANKLSRIPNLLCSRICEALYPRVIDSQGLITILKKTNDVKQYSVDIDYSLEQHFKANPGRVELPDLLERLVELGKEPPIIGHSRETVLLSNKFWWVGRPSLALLLRLLEFTELTDREVKAAGGALWFLGDYHHIHRLDQRELASLVTGLSAQPLVRRSYFWRGVQTLRRENTLDERIPMRIDSHFEELRLGLSDLAWLADDIRKVETEEDKVLTLNISLELLSSEASKRTDRRLVRRAADHNRPLKQTYYKWATGIPFRNLKRILYWRFLRTFGSKYWWMDRLQRTRQWSNLVREEMRLWINLRSLASGNKTGWLWVLAQEAGVGNASKWAAGDWNGLRRKRGTLIMRATQRGCIRAWRNFVPILPHKKTIHSGVDPRIIVGLTGIQTAFSLHELVPSEMNDTDVRLATRYGVHELNGFPDWLDDLAQSHPDPVRDILSECIVGEWGIPSTQEDVHEVLDSLAWHGKKLSQLVTPTIKGLLKLSDPENQTILRTALIIVMRNNNTSREFLAALASSRAPLYPIDTSGFITWMSVWLQTDASQAIPFLADVVANSTKGEQVMVSLCNSLRGDAHDRLPFITDPDYEKERHLRYFIPLVYQYVKPDKDVVHEGVFTPDARHGAENVRSTLLDRLVNSVNDEADEIILEFLEEPSMASHRDYLLHMLEVRDRARVDAHIWSPEDVRSFAKEFEIDPMTDDGLFKIVCRRLEDIQHDVEKGNKSIRTELRQGDDELHLRRWLARELARRANKKYTVPEEEEIDRQQRPDLRVQNPKVRGAIPVEVKWADSISWSLDDLVERLQNQLIGQYLRDKDERFGIYFLGYIGNKEYWVNSKERRHIEWEELLEFLQAKANQLAESVAHIQEVRVVGVDFRDPRAPS